MPESDRTEPVPVDSPPLSGSAIRIFAPGSCLGDRYEIRAVLGTGGFAVVYLALDRDLRREVALKVLRADRMTPTALRRLHREAAVARDVASPRLVRIFDVGSSEQAVYLTLEPVKGGTLRDLLADGALPVAEAVRLGCQILEGLAVLHGLGILHRDIKPGNVLLTADREVKLADFGLALAWERDETRMTAAESLVGTVEYVSPEQALGKEPAPRSDLYSAGLVLFEMLAGRLPFEEKGTLGTLVGRLHKRAPDVRTLRPDVPARLAAVVARLLEPDPARRYASATDALADLRAAGSWQTRAWRLRFQRRAALALLVLAAVGVGAWQVATRWPRTRFSHIVPLTPTGFAAVDEDGVQLWTKPHASPQPFLALLRRGWARRPVVAALLNPHQVYEPRYVRTLVLLDPDTGEAERHVQLPNAVERFPGFADWYGARLTAVDLDGDGWDELVVSYHHAWLWACWVVLYEPRLDRSRILFITSGHHVLAGAEDLDGDGRAELLFTGINNRMGWYSAVAAVKVVPWIGESRPGLESWGQAASPDESYAYGGDALVWYALLGRASRGDSGLLIDRSRRLLTLPGGSWVQPVELSFEGFRTADVSPRPATERQASRVEAYRHLREVRRLQRAGLPAEALAECDTALGFARRAADSVLVEWLARLRGTVLTEAGRPVEAEALFRQLAATSASASDLAFDAGRAFHLAGDLDRALAWYRRGLARGGSAEVGRGKWEFLEGIVLVLAEQRRWEEGIAEVERYGAAYPRDAKTVYREYLRWRAGEKPSRADLVPLTDVADFQRAIVLELRLELGENPAQLLRALDDELRQASETRALLSSLRGELLAGLGRHDEALAAARDAWRRARQERSTNPIARAHLDLIAGRLLRQATRSGLPHEAERVRDELRRANTSLSGASSDAPDRHSQR